MCLSLGWSLVSLIQAFLQWVWRSTVYFTIVPSQVLVVCWWENCTGSLCVDFILWISNFFLVSFSWENGWSSLYDHLKELLSWVGPCWCPRLIFGHSGDGTWEAMLLYIKLNSDWCSSQVWQIVSSARTPSREVGLSDFRAQKAH